MGGRLDVAIATDIDRRAVAAQAARHATQRVEAWAARLTRFTDTSDLSRLNSAPQTSVRIRPTLAATLDWARVAQERTNGIVDATLLDARLAAEGGGRDPEPTSPGQTWRLTRQGRRAALDRAPGIRFDLDGLAKGWLADRAAALLDAWPGVAVDADGDIALRADAGVEWLIEVADPRAPSSGPESRTLATLRVNGGAGWTLNYGVATSGTSVHRWTLPDGRESHHLIDPRTGQPAETDVIQATVLAPSAREAEVIAKTAVILGSQAALEYLGRSAALTAVLLLESGEIACLSGVEAWLA
jgi:thiamine biosynthesis lipoprotein